MGRKTKKGTKGVASRHLTRASALKKLQLSLADFRRLCIIKGIYPRDPKRKPKGKDKTYYHTKDVLYLYHEPLLSKFWDLKAYDKKIKRAIGRGEKSIARGLVKRKPVYGLYHIVKERYPTLLDCLRDLDDALCSLALFASLPSSDEKSISADVIAEATRLFDEFLLFAACKRLVRKVFCSIKGFYVQVKYLGQNITFLIPHQFPQDLPPDVDFKVMLTFLEFYRFMMISINFKVYQMENLGYPPLCDYSMLKGGCRFLALQTEVIGASRSDGTDSKMVAGSEKRSDSHAERLAAKMDSLQSKLASKEDSDQEEEEEKVDSEVDEDEEFAQDESTKQMNQLSEEEKTIQSLFEDKVFFIAREVPRLPVAFVLQSCGASLVGWQGEHSPIVESDERITHHVLDRPITDDLKQYEAIREYIQPQWIFDSINNGVCLPVSPYKSGIPPPPHLSPFVDDVKEGYVPEQRVVLQQLTSELKRKEAFKETEVDMESEEEEDDEDIEDVEQEEVQHQQEIMEEVGASDIPESKTVESVESRQSRRREQKEAEERERRKALLSKKHKRLLERIEYGKQRTSEKIAKLHSRRAKPTQ